MAKAVTLHPGSPSRLQSALKAATSVGNGVTVKERINTQGVAAFVIRVKSSSVTSDPVLTAHPMQSDAGDSDLVGTRATTEVPSTITLVNGEQRMIVACHGERYWEIEVVSDAGDAVTIDWLDVFPIANPGVSLTITGEQDVNVAQIAGVAPQLDDTDKLAVSLHAQDSAAGDTPLQVESSARKGLVIAFSSSGVAGDAASARILTNDLGTAMILPAQSYLYNGVANEVDRQRANIEAEVLAAEADTQSTRTSADQTNHNGANLVLDCDFTNLVGSTATYEPAIQAKSKGGIYTTIWTAAATLAVNGHVVYAFGRGLTKATGNLYTEAVDILIPRKFRVILTVGGTANASHNMDTLVEYGLLTA